MAIDCYGPAVDRALALVAEAFRSKRRKGTDIPYLSHLLQVMVTVAEHGGDEDQLVAALLHDYLEDVEGSSAAELEARFGPRVARMVRDLSDTQEFPKPPWAPRKQAYLAHLAGLPGEVKLVSAADKLHNASSIRRDIETGGLAVFDRFTAPLPRTLWYYRSVVRALSQDWDHPLVGAVDREVGRIHELVGVERPRGEDGLPG